MMDWISENFEKLVLGGMAALVGWSAIDTLHGQALLRRLPGMDRWQLMVRLDDKRALAAGDGISRATELPTERHPVLPSWSGDMFSPPVVDAAARGEGRISGEQQESVGGIVLHEVVPELQDMQLVGCLRGSDNVDRALIHRRNRDDVVLVRVGQRVDETSTTLKSIEFSVRREGDNQSGHNFQAAAMASFLDDQTGEQIVLDTAAPSLTGRWLAVVHVPASGRGMQELKFGDSLQINGRDYKVSKIRSNPEEVVLVTVGMSGTTTTTVLRRAQGREPQPVAVVADTP